MNIQVLLVSLVFFFLGRSLKNRKSEGELVGRSRRIFVWFWEERKIIKIQYVQYQLLKVEKQRTVRSKQILQCQKYPIRAKTLKIGTLPKIGGLPDHPPQSQSEQTVRDCNDTVVYVIKCIWKYKYFKIIFIIIYIFTYNVCPILLK